MSQETITHTHPLQDTANGWQGSDVTGHILQAPSNANGGGIRLVSASVVNGAAHGAGTAAALQLENWGTAGTAIKTTGGTIAVAIGGTADPLAANTPKSFTFNATSADESFLDAGEWLVLRKTETNSADFTRGILSIQYKMGN